MCVCVCCRRVVCKPNSSKTNFYFQFYQNNKYPAGYAHHCKWSFKFEIYHELNNMQHAEILLLTICFLFLISNWEYSFGVSILLLYVRFKCVSAWKNTVGFFLNFWLNWFLLLFNYHAMIISSLPFLPPYRISMRAC